ncbi:thiamine phosphate synthase [Candidatus Woesearchaeota archaeon]|nr:thiamine phosphate synthase [Candidatus Woesearchaeota archaeon]
MQEKIKIHFVAIGGINESRIKEIIQAGARNVAAISAL